MEVTAGRGAVRYVVDHRSEALTVLAIVAVGGFDAGNGGYFATSWGWAAVPLLWLLVFALVGGAEVRLHVLGWAWLASWAGLAAWTATSGAWSLSLSDSFLETERTTLYLAVAAAVLVLTRRRSPAFPLSLLLAAQTAVLVYALMVHVLPNSIRPYDPYAWQLADPVGYSDGLGLVAVTGLLLALGLAARGPSPSLRAVSAAAAIPAVATLYFTFSRSSWVAFAVAALAALVFDPRRTELALCALPPTVAATFAVCLCSMAPALRHRFAALSAAAHQGHVLAAELLALAAAAAVATLLLRRRLRSLGRRRLPRIARAVLTLAACGALVASLAARAEPPWTLVSRGYRSFAAPPPPIHGDLQQRLLSVSGNLRSEYWSTAWRDVAAHPLGGSGAGSFATFWLQHRPTRTNVVDAHNLYLETLAELGPPGLLLLLAVLVLPVVAAWKARGDPFVPVALAAFVAFAVHAALQWDWELPGLTAAAVVCAGLLFRSGSVRDEAPASPQRRAAIGSVLFVGAVFSSVALVGNGAVAAASRAGADGDWTHASHEAAKATRWMPWSADAWRLRAESEGVLGERNDARSSFRRALARAPNDRNLWVELASVQEGSGRAASLARAAALDPLDAVPAVEAAAWVTYDAAPSRIGFVPGPGPSPGRLRLLWVRQLDGAITAQALVTPGLAPGGRPGIVVGTAHGTIYELDQSGALLRSRQLGAIRLPGCSYLPDEEYGITGTPVVDQATSTLYVADGRGRLHALDLRTLSDRRGWPVRVAANPATEHVWGALTLARGRLYVATAILCRRGSGHLLAIDPRTRRVTTFTVVPLVRGGGGGIWGWGGPAFDASTRSLLVLTGDVLPGHRPFDEAASYAEHIVRLTPSLRVESANAPVHYHAYRDSDFTGSPIVIRAPGCPALVAGENKNGRLYVWRLGRLGAGPTWSARLEAHLNGQPAWSPRTRSLYVVGHTRLHRLRLGAGCRLAPVWSLRLPGSAVKGPPVISGDVVWFAVSGAQALWGVDGRTGRVLRRLDLREAAFAAPTILPHTIYIGAFRGLFFAFSES